MPKVTRDNCSLRLRPQAQLWTNRRLVTVRPILSSHGKLILTPFVKCFNIIILVTSPVDDLVGKYHMPLHYSNCAPLAFHGFEQLCCRDYWSSIIVHMLEFYRYFTYQINAKYGALYMLYKPSRHGPFNSKVTFSHVKALPWMHILYMWLTN